MVKPELDVSIDYYSLLNITIRADNEEIKKQYRKLGTPFIPIVPCPLLPPSLVVHYSSPSLRVN